MDSIPKPPDPFDRLEWGSLTIGDLPTALLELFFLPGNWLLWAAATYAPAVARFLEIGANGYGGVLAGCISALFWITTIVVVSIGYRAIRDFDDALTRALARGADDLRRRVRIACRLVACRIGELRKRPPAPEPVELTEEIELDEGALRLLRAHADIAAGYALPVSEGAIALRCRVHEAQRVLDRLKALGLIRPALGGPDGEIAHVLTPAGRALLLFKQMLPPASNAAAALGAASGAAAAGASPSRGG